MCEFCTKHGEGKKWYLQVKNYGEDLWNDARRQKIAKRHFGLVTSIAKRDYGILKSISNANRFIGMIIFRMFRSNFIKKHLGQVITIEDAEKIFDMVNSIVRIPCICRKASTGRDIRCCFAISINPTSIGMAEFVDKTYFSGPDISRFEKLGQREALELMRAMEPSGTIHTVWTVMTPFIGFICNCGYDGCLSMRSYREIGPIIIKSEYIATVDSALCNGCKNCIKVCLFDAIEYDAASKKSAINISKCYGCGICRSVCGQGSIKLHDKTVVPDEECVI